MAYNKQYETDHKVSFTQIAVEADCYKKQTAIRSRLL